MSPESRSPFTISPSELSQYRLPTPEEEEALGLKKHPKKDKKEPPLQEIPELSQEQIELFNEIFGQNNLEAISLPTPEELTPDYFDQNYPASQRESDTQKGLISHRPSWWSNAADAKIVGANPETWGEAYIRSIKAQAEKLRGRRFLIETLPKPTYLTNGVQQYGAKEGLDASKDRLLSLFQEALNQPTANRFNHNEDDNLQVAAAIKQAILKQAQAKHLTLPPFEIVIPPAPLFNRLAQHHPELSQTNTYEWSSTPLLNQQNQDTGHRLLVGGSDRGGASYLHCYRRDDRWAYRGVRFAVML